MKLWEVVRGMYLGIYREGCAFQNANVGVLIIDHGQLIYENDGNIVPISVDDDFDYEIASEENI